MRLGLGTDIFANFFLFLVTIVYIFSPIIGFFFLLCYLFFVFVLGKTLYMLIPMVYLAINSALGGTVAFQGISHLQLLISITLIAVLLRKPNVAGYIVKWCINNPFFLFAITLLLICCLRTGSGLTIFFYLSILVLTIVSTVAITGDMKTIFSAIIVSANQVFLFGMVELLLQKTFFYSAWTGEERYRYGVLRVGSTVSDPNYICLTLIPIALLCFYLFKIHREKKYSVYFVAYLFLCFLTMSRIGILGLLFTIYLIVRCYYFDRLKYGQRIFMNFVAVCVVATLLVMLLSIFFSTENSRLLSSNFTRNITIRYGINLFTDNFWRGVGLYQFYNYAQPLFYSQYGGRFIENLTVMNMPLEIAIAYGVPGLIAFGLLIGNSLLKAKKFLNRTLFTNLMGMLTVFLGISLTLDGATFPLLWILIALPFCAIETVKQEFKLKYVQYKLN